MDILRELQKGVVCNQKSRGKSLSTGEWVHGSGFKILDGKRYILPTGFGENIEIYPETLGRYTGYDALHNTGEGVEQVGVYEHDVIDHEHFQYLGNGNVGEVTDRVYISDAAKLPFLGHGGDLMVTVVGNKFDNPELIGEE